jgi:hypothetical protein
MEKVRVENAVGMVLAHDLTKVVPGEFKGVAFKKGHIIRPEDMEVLKTMGKYQIHILNMGSEELHEEEAAYRLAKAAAGQGICLTEPSEGKVSLKASAQGLIKINREVLDAINEIEDIILSTRHSHTLVDQDEIVAGTKIIPLVTQKAKIEQVESICQECGPVVELIPLKPLKVGLVVTGSEVYYGKIKDRFAPVLKDKIQKLGGICSDILFAPDNAYMMETSIKHHLNNGVDMIMVSGGMAVDADDLTPVVIKSIATEVVSYGSPVLPGAMFMMAYREDIPIVGVPACGMFNKITVLDLLLPRIFTNEKITKKDITSLAHGGLCLTCKVCRYPVCPLGK